MNTGVHGQHENELGKLGQERERLRQTMQSKSTKADAVADCLPDMLGRFKAALADLTTVTQTPGR